MLPPDRTVLAYKSLRISMSDLIMELNVVSAIPGVSIPISKHKNGKSKKGELL